MGFTISLTVGLVATVGTHSLRSRLPCGYSQNEVVVIQSCCDMFGENRRQFSWYSRSNIAVAKILIVSVASIADLLLFLSTATPEDYKPF